MERAQAERRSRHERSPRQVLGLGGIGREGGVHGPRKEEEVVEWRGKWRSRTKEGDGGTMNQGGDEREGKGVLFDGSDNYLGCEG